MATIQQLTLPTEGISCHAWNADGSMLAISPNSNVIHIYEGCKTGNWTRTHVLTEHDLVVSGLDWSAANNKIVSCSHDRNAFVWSYNAAENKWVPALVILRIERAALDCRWSLDGKKFAVSSGAKCVSICTYEKSSDWWVSKMLKKKFKSTVTCVAFHPTNSQLIACGSTDFKCRVYSTFSSDVDAAPDAGAFQVPVEFGETYAEMSAMGWINAVAWSPSGNTLCFAGHDSSIHFARFSQAGPVVQTIRFRELPLACLVFASESVVVGAGYDFNPMIFTGGATAQWTQAGFLDRKVEENKASSATGVAAARALFQNKANRAQDSKGDSDTLWTKHESHITNISSLGGGKIATSALDGRVVVWDLRAADVGVSMASLGI